MSQREFDNYSASYEDLVSSPIRNSFGGGSMFFHLRKRDLIRDYFRRHGRDTRTMHYLDVGCGQGELINMLRGDFAGVAGCDPSSGMLESAPNADIRVQDDLTRLPFDDGKFDFVTAVCVYHHVDAPLRPALTTEVRRMVRPGGIFAIIEHNPVNPVTRFVVSRTPVDENAVLLPARETRQLLQDASFQVLAEEYFLYLPEKIYGFAGPLEGMLRKVPLGGQYAVFARAE